MHKRREGKMNNLTRVLSASTLSLFALTAGASTVALDGMVCSNSDAINGITVGDVTGNLGGASECFGTYDGNDPGPDGSFSYDGTVYDFLAKDDGSLEGVDIGLDVEFLGNNTGTWSYDPDKFDPTEFLIVLKAASDPGYAVWLFDGSDSDSYSGDWAVAWTNQKGEGRELSHLSIYEISEVPVPPAAWLFGSGLIGLVGIARRKTLN